MRDRADAPIFLIVVHGGSLWSGYWFHQGKISRGADRLLNAEERQQWKAVDAVVYPSLYMRRTMHALWGTTAAKSIVLSNIISSSPAKKIASSLAVVEKGGGGHIYQEQNDFFFVFCWTRQ
mmetsp:Transcript_6002/g.7129  ORF Transcript_6002/g.7129 Transcript_6002/m.7129 type:complete len:121 (-) Transcript_6002:1510-1872(-)